MDNTDESFDLVPDGNYMMQKRAGVFYPVKAAAGGGGTKLTLAFVTPSNMTAVHGKETLIKYTTHLLCPEKKPAKASQPIP